MTVEKMLAGKKDPHVYTIRPDAPVDEAARLMHEKQIGALIVMDDQQQIAGILSERDMLRIWANEEYSRKMPVQDIMTARKNMILSNTANDLRYVMSLMTENNIRHIPIVHEGQLVSLLSMRDVARALLAEYEKQLLTVTGKGDLPTPSGS